MKIIKASGDYDPDHNRITVVLDDVPPEVAEYIDYAMKESVRLILEQLPGQTADMDTPEGRAIADKWVGD